MAEFKYLRQTKYLKDTTNEDMHARIRVAWRCFGKNNNKEILQDRQLTISPPKTRNRPMCIANNDPLPPNMVSQ